jgi:ABC-type spermidine/putrescine transport system permease subunit II
MPVIILALALYSFQAKVHLLGTFAGLVIGHVVLATPYVVVVMTAAVRGLDRDLEHAAAVHGARPLQTVRRILVPLLRPSLMTSGFFAFLVSFDELLVSLFLLGRQTQTLPLKFWSDIKYQIDPLLSAASSLIICAIVLVIGLGQSLRHRGQSRTAPAGERLP